jgi:hypothetical protein
MSSTLASTGALSSKKRRDFLARMSNVLSEVADLSAIFNGGKNLLDNYNWRAVALAVVLSEKEPTIAMSKSRTGTDCKIKGVAKNIEIKTCAIPRDAVYVGKSNVTAEFDKQDREGALEKLLAFDGLIIGCFNSEDACPVLTVWVQREGIRSLYPVFRSKHAEFKANWSNAGRDSIHLRLEDLKKVPDEHAVAFIREDEHPLSEVVWRVERGEIRASK